MNVYGHVCMFLSKFLQSTGQIQLPCPCRVLSCVIIRRKDIVVLDIGTLIGVSIRKAPMLFFRS